MVMMSLELRDVLPFTQVFLHAMVRDKEGRKMSKTLGNVIDPLEVIEGCGLATLVEKLKSSNLAQKEVKKAETEKKKEFPQGIPECGTDALRFGLLAYMSQGQNINLDIKRVVGYRHFCNKIWNCVKFAQFNFPEGFEPCSPEEFSTYEFSLADQWILSKLEKVILASNANFEAYQFGLLADQLYNFWLKELCDVYLEATKPALQGADEQAKKVSRNVLAVCIDHGLRLLHPLMPYLTEELYQRIPHPKGLKAASIVIAEYPIKAPDAKNQAKAEQIDADMDTVMKVVSAIRSQLGSLNVPKSKKPVTYLHLQNAADKELLTKQVPMIQHLASLGEVKFVEAEGEVPKGALRLMITETIFSYVQIADLIDIGMELERLNNRQNQLTNLIEDLKKKMGAANYETKVPQDVRETNASKVNLYETEFKTNLQSINDLKSLK